VLRVIPELLIDAQLVHSLAVPGRRGRVWPFGAVWLHSPGLWLIAVHRLTHHFECPRPRGVHRQVPFLAAKVFVVAARYLVQLVTISEISPKMSVDAGVAFSNRGHIIVGARQIGGGTVIHERVTIGMDVRKELRPTIGRRVWISPHCVVYGDISIGDDVTLLARTVLFRSVPAGAIVEGNPGRVVGNLRDHSDLRRRRLDSPTMTAAEFHGRAT
jgi:serine acetyltransferase